MTTRLFLAILSCITLAGAPGCKHTDAGSDGHTGEGVGEGEGEGEGELNVDDDGDGFTPAEGDCDDAEPAASPAQAELCDGLDNDCDGDVDEAGAVGEAVVYTDADGDGYGAGAALADTACPVDGLSQFDNDCDDDDATVSPGADEVCADEIDNDCDDDVDEADAVDATWWPDHDGDGFGNPSGISELGCAQPGEDYVLNDDDCDDNDVLQSPDALDARNGVDDDCDGEVDEAPHDFDGWLVLDQGDGSIYRTYTTHGTLVGDNTCTNCEWVYEVYFYLTECQSRSPEICEGYWQTEAEAEVPGAHLMASPWFGFGPSGEYGDGAVWQALEIDGEYSVVSESATWDSSTGLLKYTLRDSDSYQIYGEALVY